MTDDSKKDRTEGDDFSPEKNNSDENSEGYEEEQTVNDSGPSADDVPDNDSGQDDIDNISEHQDDYDPNESADVSPEQENKDTTKEKKTPNKEKKMSFLEHLEELRWTILKSLAAIVIGAIVCFFFSEQIIHFLRKPGPEDLKLIFLAPTEGFMINIKVAMYAGIVLSLPYVAWQFWLFVVPGLFEKEKKLVAPIVFFTVFCFAVGAAFAYLIIIPFGLKFLLGFQSEYLAATITIGKYLGFVITILLVFGVVFELPILSFFLTKVGILSPEFLRSKRSYGIVIIFIAAAVLTPPDIFTQLMLAGPLILLYEISIWVSSMVRKKQKQANDE